jgi:glycosyltransferase involved in cell wall biosynthesis
MNTIDIIIPSYRLQSEYLIPIIQMEKPIDVKIRYIIVADNPKAEIPNNFKEFINNENVILLVNNTNLGASETRNKGIENSTAQWILFIDDDVKPSKNLLITYQKAIQNNPNEIGFFGETLFPKPINRFTKGLIACDILTFFFIAGYYKELKWAPTANVLIKRSAIGDTRFKDIFPKNGGGEDIDFFLQVHSKTNKELQCLKDAQVFHSWWYNGERNYIRFIRWSYGDALLHTIYPQYTYYNFPNIIESLLLSALLSLIFFITTLSSSFFICALAGILTGELIMEFIRMLIYKGFKQSLFAFEGAIVRASNDIGRVYMQLFKLKRLKGFCERADHFCDGKHIKYQRLWAGLKFTSYIVLTTLIYTFTK